MKERRRYLVKLILRLIIVGLVCWGIFQSLGKARLELSTQQTQLASQAQALRDQSASATVQKRAQLLREAEQLDENSRNFWKPNWLGLSLSVLLYALGMLPSAFYWKRCLRALGQTTDTLETLWAYFLGNLGKYFPGKAMVLILRVDALKHRGVHKPATVVSIFMETLTLMAVGGAIAALSLIILNIDWRLTCAAAGLLAVTFVPTIPPVLRRVIRVVQRKLPPDELDSLCSNISWRNTLFGTIYLTISWTFMCGSLFAVVQSLPSIELADGDTVILALAIAAACTLAVVLGFVSLIPGGAGVREVVLSLILTPVIGPIAALSTAVWMRLVWLFTELAMVGILAVFNTIGGQTRAD